MTHISARTSACVTALVLLAALIVTPASAAPVAGPATFVHELLPNGRLDPGEGVLLSLCISNPDAVATGPLTGFLIPTATMIPVNPDFQVKGYGSILPGQTACRSFRVKVNAACSSVATVTVQYSDAASGAQAPLNYALSVGALGFRETFDTVTPPQIPAGWQVTTSGAATPWVVQSGVDLPTDTPPNRAYGKTAATAIENVLRSPTITVPAGGEAILSFAQFHQMQNRYDGAVLEVAIGQTAITNNTFQDIVTAGGQFLAGGYSTSTMLGSSLAGRYAWTGYAATRFTTSVRLPVSMHGQPIRLRWRLVTDATGGVENGWYVDTISLTGGSCGTPPTGAPWGLEAIVLGDRLALLWGAAFVTPDHVVEASLDGGATFPVQVPVGAQTSFQVDVPDIVAHVRVRANLGGGVFGPPSNVVAVATGARLAPEAPPHLLGAVVGSQVTLAWQQPPTGGTISQTLLEAGTSPGASNIGVVPLEAGTAIFTAGGVPAGTYYVRVRHAGPLLTGPASNEVVLTVPSQGVCTPPARPINVQAFYQQSGLSRIQVGLNAIGTKAPTVWRLVAGSSPGASDLAVLFLSRPILEVPAPTGTYYLQAFAVNDCGMSPGTPFTLTVP